MVRVEDLLLTREEVPLVFRTTFRLPIYPLLLNPNVSLDPYIAERVFAQAATDWYEEMQTIAAQEEDAETKRWYEEFFLKHEPRIRVEDRIQVMYPPRWKNDVSAQENGFVYAFSISRNGGGALIFNPRSMECEGYMHPMSRTSNMSREKLSLFAAKEVEKGDKGIHVHEYASHNVDKTPGALFLRNWVMLYLNEALRSIADEVASQ